MKLSKLVVTCLALLLSISLYADVRKGEKIAKQKGCTSCHHPSKDQIAEGKGPSYNAISAVYKKSTGKKGLVSFLVGQGKAIVKPEKFFQMKDQIRFTKKLTETQLNDLVEYILSH